MKECGFNQTTLAKASYTSRKTINEYVTGKKEPMKNNKIDSVISCVAKALNVDVEYLLGMTNYKTYTEYYFDKIQDEFEAVGKWCVDRKIEERFNNMFPFFHKEKYTVEELEELKSQIRQQIKMTLVNFENGHKKG